MNPLLTPPADDVVTSRPRTHWVDTNVMLEVYSHGDLYDEWERHQLGYKSDPEARRLRIQGALWLAMALCRQNAVTLTYQHENLNNILRLAPPGSERGGWTSTIVWTLGDGGVFEGWDRLMTTSGGKLSNRDRDRLMVKECASERFVLVTRDAQVLREAATAGVDGAIRRPLPSGRFPERTHARCFAKD